MSKHDDNHIEISCPIDFERRKRLGQYFTGTGLGRLLAALAQAEKADSIIDPMVGSGDLLASCIEIDAKPAVMAGIEIDMKVHKACSKRLPHAHCLLGNAFDPRVIAQLPVKSWDLVIANPPYVRHQSLRDKDHNSSAFPSAMQIRKMLLRSLELIDTLDKEDKRLFAELIHGYSGLSDLAVPAWILCAALVEKGGRLALIVPESWLSRDYATIVNYLLFRWFDIEFVVEDEHASWFEEAQIKTTLIIAKRIQRRSSKLSIPAEYHYCHIALAAAAANNRSPIGGINLPVKEAEKLFAKQAQIWLRDASKHETGLVSTRPISLNHSCKNMIASASRQKWFATMSKADDVFSNEDYIPHEIHEWIKRNTLTPSFDSFESIGIAVGQGLRTGANNFFYASGELKDGHVELSFLGPLSGLKARSSINIVKPTLRRQSELPNGFVISPSDAKSWTLDLRNYVLPEDIGDNDISCTSYELMPNELVKVVRAAQEANFGTSERPLKIWELTAVAPNIRPATPQTPARHWYMLPNFTPRHQPDVFLARVNTLTPKAYLNQDRACLIDANFSTMWLLDDSKWSATTILAFMNSTWVQAVIECLGSVMGGGALKVEATHLRKIPVPKFNDEQRKILSDLGKKLVKGTQEKLVILEIDRIIAEALGCNDMNIDELKQITHLGQTRRAKHKGR